MARIIGDILGAISIRLAGAAAALWIGSQAVIAMTDALDRVNAALN